MNTENQNTVSESKVEKLKNELKTEMAKVDKAEKANRDKVNKIAKLAKLQEHIESLNKKIAALIATKREVREKAAQLHKEMFGNGGSRGRGSKNFGKIKPAIEAHLAKVEVALTVRAISEALGLTYASVYQTLKNAPEMFKCVNKHWVLVKNTSEISEKKVEETKVENSVAA